MRIGLIKQNRGTGIRRHVGQHKQRLLQAATAGGQIEINPAVLVSHGNFAALFNVSGRGKFHSEKRLHFRDQIIPEIGARRVYSMAEVSQHLRGASFTDPYIDGPLIQTCFGGRKAGHRRQKRYVDRGCGGWNRHTFGVFSTFEAHWPAIEGFLVCVIELEAANPSFVVVYAFDQYIDPDIFRSLATVGSGYVSHMQVTPKQICDRNGDRRQIPAVYGDARAFPGSRLSRPLFLPPLDADVPKRQRLHRRSLAGIIRPHKDNRVAQFNFHLPKSFEIPDFELGEHCRTPRLLSSLARMER